MKSIHGEQWNDPSGKSHSSRLPQQKRTLNGVEPQHPSRMRSHLPTPPLSVDSKPASSSLFTQDRRAGRSGDQKEPFDQSRLRPSPLLVRVKPDIEDHQTMIERSQGEAAKKATASRIPSKNLRQWKGLEARTTTQDHTISELQAQPTSLRAPKIAQTQRLADAQAAEINSLQDHVEVLEKEKPKRTFPHSNGLSFAHKTAAQQSLDATLSTEPLGSVKSRRSQFEQETENILDASARSRHQNPEMDSFRQRLRETQRLERGNGDAIRELNIYKQNNDILQKQIDNLMTKLNQSEREEYNLKRKIDEIRKTVNELQAKADTAEELTNGTRALQNTVDHLTHRLEIANIEKVDAEEQLLLLQSNKSPFYLPKLRISKHAGLNLATNVADKREFQDSRTLSAFIQHIEKLQEELTAKDDRCAKLELEHKQLQRDIGQAEKARREISLQHRVQGKLLHRAEQNEVHISELRSTIIQWEALFDKTQKALENSERQLDHHKSLLADEVRQHAAFALSTSPHQDRFPYPAHLDSQMRIEKARDQLQRRLVGGRAPNGANVAAVDSKATIEHLEQEVEFYVREIIYYKFDIKGYKQEVRQLKKQIGIEDCNAGSLKITPTFLSSSQPAGTTTNVGVEPGEVLPEDTSATPVPILTGPRPVRMPPERPMTPPLSATPTDTSPYAGTVSTKTGNSYLLRSRLPLTPITPLRGTESIPASETGDLVFGKSPRSLKTLSPQHPKCTSPSYNSPRLDKLATNSLPSTTATSERINMQNGISTPNKQLHMQPKTPERPLPAVKLNSRSAGILEPHSHLEVSKKLTATTNEAVAYPVRHQSKFSNSPENELVHIFRLRTPPRKDIMAEAMQHSPQKNLPAQTLSQPNTPDAASSLHPLYSAAARHSTFPASSEFLSIPSSQTGSAQADSTVQTRQLPPSTPPRRPSTASSSNIPFVIAMGSPHNPALLSPATPLPSVSRSNTGKPTKTTSPGMRSGVGGTMASSTSVSSPSSLKDNVTSYFSNAFRTPREKPLPKIPQSYSPSTGVKPSNKARPSAIPGPATLDTSSLVPAKPRLRALQPTHNLSSAGSSSHTKTITPLQTRILSGSALRQAINLPNRRDFMKGKGKTKKDGISLPTPLASPFDLSRTMDKN